MKNTFFISLIFSIVSFAFINFCILALTLSSRTSAEFVFILLVKLPVILVIGFISSKWVPIPAKQSVLPLFLVVLGSTFSVIFLSSYVLLYLEKWSVQISR